MIVSIENEHIELKEVRRISTIWQSNYGDSYSSTYLYFNIYFKNIIEPLQISLTAQAVLDKNELSSKRTNELTKKIKDVIQKTRLDLIDRWVSSSSYMSQPHKLTFDKNSQK